MTLVTEPRHPDLLRDGRSRQVAAAEPQPKTDVLHGNVEVPTGAPDGAVCVYDERAVELSQFLDRAPQILIEDARACRRVTGQGIQDERARARQHEICLSQREQRTDPAALTPLTGNLDRQIHETLQHIPSAPEHTRPDAVEDRHRKAASPSRRHYSFARTSRSCCSHPIRP